ncbi:MAG: hypothetical protein JST92_14585 [Deltaproteobacteria bacterium]|nr:hypothetical protein [Deltaproteobacteria bacterium]
MTLRARPYALSFSTTATLLLLASACATPPPAPSARAPSTPLTARVNGPFASFEITCDSADAGSLGLVGSALLQAATKASRWGSFRSDHAIDVRVLRDHAALEGAVGHEGYAWLRGWAFSDRVLLQNPRTWPETTDEQLHNDLDELLAHELTHVLMYQAIEPQIGPMQALLSTGREPDEPPLWFREGLASVTAGQGAKRLSPAQLGQWLDRHPGAQLLEPDAELVRTEKEAVYGAAHRAFELFLSLSGDQGVTDLLRAMKGGARFSDAFTQATGLSLKTFEGEALRGRFSVSAIEVPAKNHGAGGP